MRNIISSGPARCIAMILILAAAFSCKDDEGTGEIYVRFNNESLDLTVSAAGGAETYEMYTNLKKWNIEVDYYTENNEWCDVYDYMGSGSGKFVITVAPNTREPFVRRAVVKIVSDGVVYSTINVSQQSVNAFLELDMNGMSEISTSNRGASRLIKLNTNVLWDLEIPAEAHWIEHGEATDYTQELIIHPTDQETMRETTVTFRMIGTGNESVNTDLVVKQRGNEWDVSKAREATIAEVLTFPYGTITDNVYITGYVVSDNSTGNLAPEYMIVQDESGKGLMLEFENYADNDIEVNTKVQLHLIGYPIILSDSTGGTRLTSISKGEALISSEPSSGIAPVEVTDLSTIDQYENVLVKLKNVEFAIPVGTYVNIHEDNYNNTEGGEPSKPDSDTPRYFAHYLRDPRGGTARLYTYYKFLEKFDRVMPEGSGDLTGLAIKRKKHGTAFTSIMLRYDSDNGVADDRSGRSTRMVTRFGPWSTTETMERVNATAGSGYIKTSLATRIHSTSSSSNTMYWGWTYCRIAPATVNPITFLGNPPLASNLNIQYSLLNCQTWWDGTGSSIHQPGDEAAGEAWIITTSTKGATGKLFLSFLNSSSTTGPRDFRIEWSTAEDTPLVGWQPIDDFIAADHNNNYHHMQYTYALPDAMKDLDNVVIRLRVTTTKRASNSTALIAAGGTNRLAYLAIEELK